MTTPGESGTSQPSSRTASTGIAVRGRIRELSLYVQSFGNGEVILRVDSDKDTSFWLEITITKKQLQDLIVQADHPREETDG